MEISFICDFDGTISVADTADAVFSAFARPEWEEVELLWKAGEIGSAECMRRQMELVDATKPEIDAVLDTIAVDDTFKSFSHYCAKTGYRLTVVSDGVDYFIKRILSRQGLGHLPILANRLIQKGPRSFTLGHPNSVKDCASGAGTCKCACANRDKKNYQTILIGDGRSDFCVAHEADMVFAKKSLLTYTAQQNIPAIAFESFGNIQAWLEQRFAEAAEIRSAVFTSSLTTAWSK